MSTSKEEHRLQQLLNAIDRLDELGEWSQRFGIDRNAVQRSLDEVRAERGAEEADRREAEAERDADAQRRQAAQVEREDFERRLDEIFGKG